MWLIIPFILVIILILVCNIPLRNRGNKDIAILYKRTDKKTKEFENERQIRVKLQKRLTKLEHETRKQKSRHSQAVREVLKLLKEKNEPAA